MLQQLFKYGLVGVVNTGITVAVVVLLTLAGTNIFLANALGFSAGLLNSYLMNRRFTFSSTSGKTAIPFLVSFLIAYAINGIALILTSSTLEAHPLYSQAAGIVSYNIPFFILMKSWVFSRAARSDDLHR